MVKLISIILCIIVVIYTVFILFRLQSLELYIKQTMSDVYSIAYGMTDIVISSLYKIEKSNMIPDSRADSVVEFAEGYENAVRVILSFSELCDKDAIKSLEKSYKYFSDSCKLYNVYITKYNKLVDAFPSCIIACLLGKKLKESISFSTDT